MQIQTTHLGLRIGATLLAIGYGVVGWYVMSVSDEAPSPELAERALWMGVTFVIAAVGAASVSWLVADLSNIWCIPPRRTPQPRLTLERGDSRVSNRQQGSNDTEICPDQNANRDGTS